MTAALVASLVVASVGASAPTFTVVPGHGTLTYHLVHRFHAVTGVSRAAEGKVRVLPDGTVQVMVRAPLVSFDSGERNRDANMREVTGAAQNPFVEFKGVGHLATPSSYPAELKVPLRGELTLKTPRPIDVEATVRFESAQRVRVSSRFPISLEDHHVERPSLLFVKVNDRVDIDAELELSLDPSSSGG